MKNLIFLGGIHGAGKNYLQQTLQTAVPLTCLTASEVLNWREISHNPDDKRVSAVAENQDRLLQNLSRIVQKDKFYLLDGHFTLLNAEGHIEKLPPHIFQQIAPRALILKTAEPADICQRLFQRDGRKWSLELVSAMQNAETAYAQELSSALKIPLYQLSDHQEKQFSNLINREFTTQSQTLPLYLLNRGKQK